MKWVALCLLVLILLYPILKKLFRLVMIKAILYYIYLEKSKGYKDVDVDIMQDCLTRIKKNHDKRINDLLVDRFAKSLERFILKYYER